MKIGLSVFQFSLAIWLGLFALSIPMAGHAQEYKTYQKLEDNTLRFRWEPQSWAAFDQVLSGEMALEVFAVTGPSVQPELRILEQRLIEPTAMDTWLADLPATNWDSSALAATHVSTLPKSFRDETFLAQEYGDTPVEERENRWQISNYVLNYSWSAIANSSMGFEIPVEAGIDQYAAKLYPTPAGDTIYFTFYLKDYTPPKLPKFKADWKDRQVELSWRTLEFRDLFFGWMVEKSINGGPFANLFELPLINDLDTLERESDALKFIYHTDNLANNDDEITYRLRGHDFLGGRSSDFIEIIGSGLADIEYSPLLTKTIQTDSNYAVINWEYDKDQEALVQEFRIIHTDSLDGDYEIILQGIAPQVRQAIVPMKYRSNYYRVQAVSLVGTVYSSFESLVLAYDDKPPAVPRDFTGYIDSMGIAHLSWVTSNEPDLKGYYLFKGYFPEAELAMITPTPLQGPTHLDTTKTSVAHETIYFQLRSVDFRGNSSNFTPVLALKKPDLYPPAAPQIVEADNDGEKIRLRWVKSPSSDVVSYTLYRKELTNNTGWEPILTFPAETFQRRYVDSLVQPGIVYAYSILATDDDGLVSEHSQPISLTLKDFGLRAPIQNLTASQPSNEKAIILSWEYGDRPREFYLYKGTDDQPVSLLKVVNGDQREFRDEGVRKGRTYRYLLRAVFPNGKVSPFTEEVGIQFD